ncbi:hypothetical protein MUU74_01780 [Chryseobacterium daecheongense]|uniref:hypothetical protein n=1 Tax=Chryseobacterium daecheongense TaxID=192389 RepID=UPI001FD69B3E|nr:hypothetical protein [Chryseobacterium daecheongense]UOU98697.1 hypothetical protein MUU74_01780 [Chryseobacterium daecheongense]
MKKILFKALLFVIILLSMFCNSQTVTVQGIVKDSLGTNGIGISVNDTIRKFRDKAFKDKNWNGYHELVNNKKFFTYPDSIGNYSITAKITDTLYFFKRKYITQKYKIEDIIKDSIKVYLKPIPCIPDKKCIQRIPTKLYIFAGSKINVSTIDRSKRCGETLDTEYRAEYKIEQEFADHYPNSTIVFTAYDHNSMYEYDFSNYDNILVFVGEYCGDLIHFKYQFFPLYKTANGKWASPVKAKDEYFYNKTDEFKPTNINFDKTVSFDLPVHLSTQQMAQLIQHRFPEKYYKIENGKAIPIMGRYAEDLMKLWKKLYLENLE